MSEAVHARPHRLIWLDLETTGLDPQKDDVLEVAYAVTPYERWWAAPFEPQTFLIAGGWDAAEEGASARSMNFYSQRTLRNGTKLSPEVAMMHAESGLLADLMSIPDSTSGGLRCLHPDAAAQALPGVETGHWTTFAVHFMIMLDRLGIPKERHLKPVLAGSSVGFDLGFLKAKLLMEASRLSHRVFDVSTLVLQARSELSASGTTFDAFLAHPNGWPWLAEGKTRHRAKDDVTASFELACAARLWLRTIGMDDAARESALLSFQGTLTPKSDE